jgi:hypothetical protein
MEMEKGGTQWQYISIVEVDRWPKRNSKGKIKSPKFIRQMGRALSWDGEK